MLEIDEGEWPWILFATDLLVWATEDDPEYMHTNGEVWLDGMNYTRAKMSALWYATVARRKKARQQAIYDAGGSQTGLKQIDLRGPQWSPDVYMRLLS